MADIRAELAAKAEEALAAEDDIAIVEKEKADEAEAKKESDAADEGDTSDDSEDAEDDLDDDEDSDDDDEDDEDDLDDLDEEEEEKKPNRSQKRIKELVSDKNIRDTEIAELKAQIAAAKDSTKSDKDKTDEKLLKDGYSPEQIAEGKKFIKSLGLDIEGVSKMQNSVKSIQETEFLAKDRADLLAVMKKTKTDLTEKEIMARVDKWSKSDNPRIQARASLDYKAIIKLISAGSKTVKKVEKKKGAPEVPKGGGGNVKTSEADETLWNPGDRAGSMDRLLAKVDASFDE